MDDANDFVEWFVCDLQVNIDVVDVVVV